MSQSTYDLVQEFHEAFGHPVRKEPVVPPVGEIKFRARFILEETVELIQALGGDKTTNRHLARAIDLLERARDQIAMAPDYEFNAVDLIGVADALGDLDYIINGAALTFGMPQPEVVIEIHSSNMTKLSPDGKPIYNEEGKVVKGPNYRAPDLKMILFPEPLELEAD